MRTNLTSLAVEAIKPPELGQVTYWDKKLAGFGLRVSQGGRKTWVCVYRHNGRLRWLTLGNYPITGVADARLQARQKLADVQKGVDVATMNRKAREADIYAVLCTRYIAEHARVKKKPKSVYEDERIIRRELLPEWGSRKAAEIRRRDVIELVDKIALRGAPIHANRTLALVSTIFNFGVSKEIIESNPAYRVPKPGAERRRDRVLSEAEIRKVWDSLRALNPKVAPIFKLALLTAQRRSEICGMRWSELDLDAGWWTIPAERSKNHLSHRVPITGEALSILLSLKEAPIDPVHVFRGRRIGSPLASLQKPIRRLKVASAVDFKFHDLGRTAASHMTGIGIPRLIVGKILNHVERGITAVYDRHGYDREKREALSKWNSRLTEIVGSASLISESHLVPSENSSMLARQVST